LYNIMYMRIRDYVYTGRAAAVRREHEWDGDRGFFGLCRVYHSQRGGLGSIRESVAECMYIQHTQY